MENKAARVHMTFEFLSDAKTMFELLMKQFAQVRDITQILEAGGLPINSRTMGGYRNDARFLLSSVMAVGDEILRLHEQCGEPDCLFTKDPEHAVAAHDKAEAGAIEVLRAIHEEHDKAEGMGLISEDEEIAILASMVGKHPED